MDLFIFFTWIFAHLFDTRHVGTSVEEEAENGYEQEEHSGEGGSVLAYCGPFRVSPLKGTCNDILLFS